MKAKFGRTLVSDTDGNMAEYALVIALVAVIAIAAFSALGGGISGLVNGVASILGGGG